MAGRRRVSGFGQYARLNYCARCFGEVRPELGMGPRFSLAAATSNIRARSLRSLRIGRIAQEDREAPTCLLE
jgi:hypothetical protein